MKWKFLRLTCRTNHSTSFSCSRAFDERKNEFKFNFNFIFLLTDAENEDKKLLQQLKREQTVKDLTQKLSNLPLSPQEEKPNRIVGDMSGLISKAKEELNKSKNKVEVKTNVETDLKKPEPKKSEIELHWEELMKNLDRDLILCDLDFRDLTEQDETNIMKPQGISGSSIPPPPPAMGINNSLNPIPPPMIRSMNGTLNGNSSKENSNGDFNGLSLTKTKKTVSLFMILKHFFKL